MTFHSLSYHQVSKFKERAKYHPIRMTWLYAFQVLLKMMKQKKQSWGWIAESVFVSPLMFLMGRTKNVKTCVLIYKLDSPLQHLSQNGGYSQG